MYRRLAVVSLALAGIHGAFLAVEPAFARGGRHAAMILDANSGAVLHAEDADEPRHPASLTKMMTLYLTFETIESGRLSMSDKIKISQEAANQAPSKLELDPGEEITVSDAVRALITKSANDVAVALAEKVGGSEKNFARLMNTRARDLGMMKTNFENASGLPNSEQVTTARDMITLGLRLQDDFPQYYPLFAMRSFTYNRSSYRNHNTMLNNFQGIDGIKTGYTQKSGFNLVSSVRRGGRHVVGAVFGGASAATRNGEMRMLLTRALSRASTVKTRKPAPSLIAKLKSAPKIAERPKPKDKPPVQVAIAATAAPVIQAKPFAPAKPVAQAAPKPAPTIAATPAAKPAPQPVAEAVAGPVAEAAPAPVQTAAVQPAPVDVFKVKRVMVAPRQGPKAPPPNPAETTDQPEDTTETDSVSVMPPDAPIFTLASAETPAPADKIAETFAAADAPQADPMSETVVPKLAAPAIQPAAPQTVATPRPAPLDSRMAVLGPGDAGRVE
ncbi:MAG: serine hydrolase, partial [Hyphomicrobium sp.]